MSNEKTNDFKLEERVRVNSKYTIRPEHVGSFGKVVQVCERILFIELELSEFCHQFLPEELDKVLLFKDLEIGEQFKTTTHGASSLYMKCPYFKPNRFWHCNAIGFNTPSSIGNGSFKAIYVDDSTEVVRS